MGSNLTQDYRNVINDANLGVFSVDVDGHFLEVNSVMARMLGFADPARVVAGEDGTPEVCASGCLALLEEASRNTSEVVVLELDYPHPEGGSLPVRVHVQRVLGDEGHEFFVGVIEDLSLLRQAEAASEAAKEHSKVLFNFAADAMFLHNEDGIIQDVNPAACERLLFERDELLGLNMAELETEKFAKAFPDQVERLKAYGELSYFTEQKRSDGTLVPTEINVRLAEVGGEKLALAVSRDVSEFLRVQDALKASLADVEKLVSERTRELSLANEQLVSEIEGRKRDAEQLERSEKKYRTLVETTDTGFVIVDEQGFVLDANSKYVELTGYKTADEIIGRSVVEWTAAHEIERNEEAVARCLAEGSIHDFQVDFSQPDGRFQPVEVNASVVEVLGGRQIHALCRDITARREAEREIKTLSRAVEQSPASVIITNSQGVIEYVNSRFTEVTGYTAKEAIGNKSSLFKSGQMDEEFYKRMWATISSGNDWRGEFCNMTKAGEIFWESASISPIFDTFGTIVQYVAVKEDITEQKRQQDYIRKLALYDSLTALPNRTLFMDRLTQAIARSVRTGNKAALLYIDLNKFKPINDTFGHQTGDEVLKEVAKRILKSVREADTAARIGGDEFVAILQDVEQVKQIEEVAKRIIERIDQPYMQCNGKACPQLGAAIGIALCPDHGKDSDTLIRCADQAMYRVKKTGRSDFAYWSK